MFVGDHECNGEGHGTPTDLRVIVSAHCSKSGWMAQSIVRTAVIVSMHRTNGSEFIYLESENAYSFHSCPKRSCLPGMLA